MEKDNSLEEILTFIKSVKQIDRSIITIDELLKINQEYLWISILHARLESEAFCDADTLHVDRDVFAAKEELRLRDEIADRSSATKAKLNTDIIIEDIKKEEVAARSYYLLVRSIGYSLREVPNFLSRLLKDLEKESQSSSF